MQKDAVIPKYAVIDTKLTDENGKKVFYSTVEDSELTE
jgi:ActR/RegA family two-component response regulator